MTVDDFHAFLVDLLDDSRQLAAIAAGVAQPGDPSIERAYFAIMNAPSDEGWVSILEFVNSEDEWRFYVFINARTTTASSNEWLSGTCSECYDYFERWPSN